jgi:hypothetical protein
MSTPARRQSLGRRRSCRIGMSNAHHLLLIAVYQDACIRRLKRRWWLLSVFSQLPPIAPPIAPDAALRGSEIRGAAADGKLQVNDPDVLVGHMRAFSMRNDLEIHPISGHGEGSSKALAVHDNSACVAQGNRGTGRRTGIDHATGAARCALLAGIQLSSGYTMDPRNKRRQSMERHVENDSATTQPPPPRRTPSGLVAAIAIAIMLLALAWPDSTGYDRRSSTALSEQ